MSRMLIWIIICIVMFFYYYNLKDYPSCILSQDPITCVEVIKLREEK